MPGREPAGKPLGDAQHHLGDALGRGRRDGRCFDVGRAPPRETRRQYAHDALAARLIEELHAVATERGGAFRLAGRVPREILRRLDALQERVANETVDPLRDRRRCYEDSTQGERAEGR